MKKFFKALIVVMILTIATAIPCFAQELTPINPDVTEAQFLDSIDAHNKVVAKQLEGFVVTQVDPVIAKNHVDIVVAQLKNYNKAAANNYVDYRKKRVIGFKETERIKAEVVANYKWLSQYNPAFANLIPAAEADYNTAVAIRKAEEAEVIKITNDFKVLFPY